MAAGLVVGLLLFAACGGSSATVAESASGADEPAPLADIDGPFPVGERIPVEKTFERFDGSSGTFGELRGKPVLLNFWASWCPACIAELPDLVEAHATYGKDVTFVGIAQADQRSGSLEFAERFAITYTLADDPQGDLYRQFESISMPVSILLDSEGTVLERHNGILTSGQLDEKLTALR